MNKIIIGLFLFLCPGISFATTWTPYFVYQPTSQVTNSNLNGNNNSLGNILNGGLDNSNANTAGGYRFFQTVGSLPSYGNQGAVYFLTSGNTLNFDTGTSFVQTITAPSSPVQGNILYYGSSNWSILAPGTNGYFLQTQGPGANPVWSQVTYSTTGEPYIKMTNSQTSGTSGGTATSGSWLGIPVNTTDIDTGSNVVSLNNSTGVFVLVAGTYDIDASQPFHGTINNGQIRLQNTTAVSTVLIGDVCDNASTASTTTSRLAGRFTVAAAQSLQLQYQVTTTKATDGLGVAGSFGTEVFAQIILHRVS